MGEITGIRWTDHTFNGWWGCKRVSEACRFCYAESLATRFGFDVWGESAQRRTFDDAHWNEPLRWNRKAEASGEPKLCFCASMADVFEDHPELPAQRERLWELIAKTPWLTWQLLTKRPENIRAMVPSSWLSDWPAHVWAGTTVESPRWAEERLPHLVRVPAPVLFVSGEPLFGPLDLTPWMAEQGAAGTCFDIGGSWWHRPGSCPSCCGRIGWVIAGGESGPKARPSHPDWFRSLRDQCQRAGVPFLFKQWGEWAPSKGYGGPLVNVAVSRTRWQYQSTHLTPEGEVYDGKSLDLWLRGTTMLRVGKKAAGWVLDGRTWDEIPPRQSPTAVGAVPAPTGLMPKEGPS